MVQICCNVMTKIQTREVATNSIFELMWLCSSFDSHCGGNCEGVSHPQPGFDPQVGAWVRLPFKRSNTTNDGNFPSLLNLAYRLFCIRIWPHGCFTPKRLISSMLNALPYPKRPNLDYASLMLVILCLTILSTSTFSPE
jgi:hypothetical protein